MTVRFRNLELAIQSGDSTKISEALNSAKKDVHLSSFLVQTDASAKQNIADLMTLVLPLTESSDLKISKQSEGFVAYWGSLLSAFAPSSLRSAFSSLDSGELEPIANPELFAFWTESLRSVAISQRQQLVGSCHSMLLATPPEHHQHVSMSVWRLIRDSMKQENLKSIIIFFIDTKLAPVVAFLCQKNPIYFFRIVAARASPQFLKELIGNWPLSQDIDVGAIREKIINNIQGSDSSTKSTALEIVNTILERFYDQNKTADAKDWKEIINAMINVYKGSTIAQKAAMIDIFYSACKIGLIALDDVKQFLTYDSNIPSPILVSSVHLTSLFIKEGQIPGALLDFLRKQSIERDPIVYVSILSFLKDCFNDLYKYVPINATDILNLCLNPMPNYFVEQVQIIQLLSAIDFSSFPERNLKTPILEIVLKFIENPHPSVVAEIPALMEHSNIQLPLTSLNWFDNASSYLPLVSSIDPSFVIELIDEGLLPAASYEIAIDMILTQVTKTKKLRSVKAIFKRVMSVIIAGLKVLDLPFDRCLLSTQSNDWEYITSSLPGLLDIISEPLLSSTFGKIMNSSLLIISSIIQQCIINVNVVVALIDLCTVLSQAFTSTVCDLIVQLKEMSDILFPESKERIDLHIKTFFEQAFPFDFADSIALSCLKLNVDTSYCAPYIYTSAETSREVISILSERETNLPISAAFLAVKNDKEYMKKCAAEIPFEDWIYIESEDESVLDEFSGIKVENFSLLPDAKKKAVRNHPKVFDYQEDETENTVNDTEGEREMIAIPELETNKGEFLELPIKEKIKERKERPVPSWFTPTETTEESKEDEDEESEITQGNAKVLPESIYPYREPSDADLFGFLWFSFRKLADNEWRTVESYVLNTIDDDRILSACLSYAIRHGFPIRKDRWCNKLEFERKHFKLLAAALLLSLLDPPLTPIQAIFIEDVMAGLGYINASEESIMRSLSQETGIPLLVVQRVAYLTNYVMPISTKEDVLNQLDSLLEMPAEESARSLSLLFEELPPSFVDRFELPPGVNLLRLTVPVAVEISKPQRSNIDSEVINKFIDRCTKCTDEHQLLFILNVLKHCDLDSKQEETFEDIIENLGFAFPMSHIPLLRILPTLTAYKRMSSGYGSMYNTLVDRANTMPPSFTRCLCQCYLTRGLEVGEDSKRLFRALPRVLFEFLPRSYEKIFPSMFDTRFGVASESCLCIYPITSERLSLARQTMSRCESAAPRLTHQLLKAPNLRQLFNTVNDETAVIEVSQQLLSLASSDFRYIYSVINVIRILIEYTPIDGLVVMCMSGSFLNGKNFASIFVALSMITDAIKKHPESMKKDGDSIDNMISMLFIDERRLELFKDKDPIHALSIALKGDA